MNFLDAILLGVVEGITEFLPISSTAHLILAGRVLGIPDSEFLKSFEIAIQLGAILAVVTLYWRSFLNFEMLKKIAAGFIPTAILGLIFYKSVKAILGDVSVVLWALFIGGIILIAFEKWYKKKVTSIPTGTRDTLPAQAGLHGENMSVRQCVVVGLCQAVAFIPGVSRAAATIIGGLAMGISRKTIAEYSFLLAVPTMAAATGLDLIKNRESVFSSENLLLILTGLFVSYIVAIYAIKMLLSFIQKHNFSPFGVYRVLIAVAGFLILF